jgi:hypothetical protein
MSDRLPLLTAITFALFVGCCFLISTASEWISRSEVVTYALLGLTAFSMFGWPILLVWSVQQRRRRRQTTRTNVR